MRNLKKWPSLFGSACRPGARTLVPRDTRAWLSLAHCACLFIGISVRTATAQGTLQPVTMRTGTGLVLQTQSVSFKSGELGLTPVLPLYFGFATQEQAQPGVFTDSFTISLQSSAGIIYLLTADANGVQWAPATPGAWPISDASIQRSTTDFAVPAEGLSPVAAYKVSYAVPTEWQTLPFQVDFDLFDNQNTTASLAYFSVIPEPSAALLLCVATGLWIWGKRR